jgi:hypothetical protein
MASGSGTRGIHARRAERMGRGRTGRAFALAIAVAVACGTPVGSSACDLTRFGEDATNTCARTAVSCLPSALPDDVKRIARGAVLESAGVAGSEGRTTWRALDMDRLEVVVVERYSGARRAQAPTVAVSSDDEFLKTVDAADAVDHVRRGPLSERQVDQLGCLAAPLWSLERAASRPSPGLVSRFHLLRSDRARTLEVSGAFAGAPGDFARAADAALPLRRGARR